MTGLGHQQPGQRSETRTNLQHVVMALQLRRRHNAPELIGIMEKILAEGSGQPDFVPGQDFFYGRQRHRRPKTSARVSSAPSSWRCVIVSGGVKLSTFACSPSGRRMKPRSNMAFTIFK